jgi:hypothetical protein
VFCGLWDNTVLARLVVAIVARRAFLNFHSCFHSVISFDNLGYVSKPLLATVFTWYGIMVEY